MKPFNLPRRVPQRLRRLVNAWAHAPARVMACMLAGALLAACTTSSPPAQLYRLNLSAPVASAPRVPGSAHWQLMQPVGVPDYLDRDALLLPLGPAGLQAQPGHRWAEPLRSSVPRVLRQDLATLLGDARVWAAPVPAGVTITWQLRVELLALDVDAGRSSVTLRARWAVTSPTGTAPPRVDTVALSVPSAGTDVDSLVAAHRLALWRLAERMADGAP